MAERDGVLNYQLRFYEKGGVVFYEGEYGDCFYDIQQGSVGVFVNYKEDDEMMVAKLSKGDYFGETAIIETARRNATIIALESNTILRLISEKELPDYAKENPKLVVEMMMKVSKHLKEKEVLYNDACRVMNDILACKKKKISMPKSLMDDIKIHADNFKKEQ